MKQQPTLYQCHVIAVQRERALGIRSKHETWLHIAGDLPIAEGDELIIGVVKNEHDER